MGRTYIVLLEDMYKNGSSYAVKSCMVTVILLLLLMLHALPNFSYYVALACDLLSYSRSAPAEAFVSLSHNSLSLSFPSYIFSLLQIR